MSKAAVVTGASSGIGLEIARALLELSYTVYGIARDFGKAGLSDDRFIPFPCDVTDIAMLAETAENVRRTIRSRGERLHVLVNNAGVGYFGPHEQLTPAQIAAMVDTNLKAPLILAQRFLRDIKQSQGFIINISSVTAKKSSTHGCAYAATKAALTHFGVSLFDEIRKTGAKVINIHPDMTRTPFYERADFREGDDPLSFLTPECVADAVKTALSQREGTVITDITIRPQKHQITRKSPPKPSSRREDGHSPD